MIAFESIPQLLVLGLALLLFAGVSVLIWGRRIPRIGGWLIGAPALFVLFVAFSSWNFLSEVRFEPRIWARGWIGLVDQPGAITVGIIQDAIGMALSGFVVLLSVLVLLGRSVLPRFPPLHPSRASPTTRSRQQFAEFRIHATLPQCLQLCLGPRT